MSEVDHIPALKEIFSEAFLPPSRESCPEWVTGNVELDNTSAMPGKVRFDFLYPSKRFLEWAQDRRSRRVTAMVSAQSTKTQNLIFYILWRTKNKPTPTMWVMANGDNCEEFGQKRLHPAIQNCKEVSSLAPPAHEWTKKMILFDTMPLLLRGSQSKVGLQSDPIGLIICDERREWRKGAIDLLRKRQRTFPDALELSVGTAGDENDELHRDFEDGSQTFFHFNCLECDHSQPIRFGKIATALYPEERNKGGIIWETSDITRPDGKWDECVKDTVRLECEACGHRYHNNEKPKILKSLHEHHRNPKALNQGKVSLHWNAFYMPWASCNWGELVWEYLMAQEEKKIGNVEPLRAFVTETLGEPWQINSRKAGDEDKLLKALTGDYCRGEALKIEKNKKGKNLSVKILTIDRQQSYLVWVVRQWQYGTLESRAIDWGTIGSYEDLREIQKDHDVNSQAVWGDDGGPNVSDWRKACVKYGWRTMKGEDFKHFKVDGVNKGFRRSKCDPGLGTSNQGRREIELWLWSNPWYKDKLYNNVIDGKGPRWEIPRDYDKDYGSQITAEELREKEKPNGQKEHYWHRLRANHYGDCELMQLVVVDAAEVWRKRVD